MNTHSSYKPKKFKQTLSACQKADSICFLGQQRSADGGILATRVQINVISVLRIIQKNWLTTQNKRRGMMTSGVVSRYNNVRRQTAART
jgi:hypothetical protein